MDYRAKRVIIANSERDMHGLRGLTALFVRQTLFFNRRAVEFGSMLRCTLGVVLAFALGHFAGVAENGALIALGAFICGFISLEGIYRSRIKLIVATAAGIAIASFVGAFAAMSLPLLLALTACVGYVTGVFAQVSRLAGAVAMYTCVTFIVFSHTPLPLDANVRQSCFLLCGACIQVALLIASYPFSRFALERRALAGAFVELTRFADATTGEYRKAPPAVGLIAARQMLDDPQPFAAARDIVRFRRLLGDIERLRSKIAGIHASGGDAFAEVRTQFLHACIEVLRNVVLLLEGKTPHVDASQSGVVLRRALQHFETCFAENAAALALARSTVVDIRDAMQGATVIAEGKFSTFLLVASARPGEYVEAQLDWRSREAFRLAAVLTLAMFIGHAAVLQRGYWVALTAALILKPDLRTTFVRGLSRIGGTLIGAVTAAAFLSLHPSGHTLEAAMVVCGAICYATFLANYGIFTISVTVFVICFLAMLGFPSDFNIQARVIDTLLGGALAMLAYLIFPTLAHRRTREVLADLISTQAAFADRLLEAYATPGVFDRAGLESLRIRAWKLRIHAESLVDRARTDPASQHALGAERVLNLLASTQSFALINLALESGLGTLDCSDYATQIESFRRILGARMAWISGYLRDGKDARQSLESATWDAGGWRIDDEFLLVHFTGYLEAIAALRDILIEGA